MSRVVPTLLVVLVASGTFGVAQQAAAPLAGVWQLEETTAPDGTVNKTTRGLHIFTRQYYSTVRLAESAKPAALTDAQKVALFDALIADTGRYETNGNVLTRHSIASKTPAAPGATPPITDFKIEGNSLWLYPRPNGQPASPKNYIKFTRVE